MNRNAQQSTRGKQGAILRTLVNRAGWWGVTSLLAGLFFLLGGGISLLNGDFSVALQAFVIMALLFGAAYFLATRKGN